jgi:photosystem II stability/assembly factor-like uncharacterized protein
MRKIFTTLLFLSGAAYSQTAVIESLGPSGGMISHFNGSSDDSVVLAVVGEHEVFRSTNGGDSWEKIDIPSLQLKHAVIHNITFHPFSSGIILLPTSLGLYRSNDKGATWFTVTDSLHFSPTYSVKYVPGIPEVLFGSDDNGVLRSTDGGMTWMRVKDGLMRHIAIHPGDTALASLRLVATTGFDDTTGIFVSTNGGAAWSPLVAGLPQGDARKIYSVGMDSTGLSKKDYRVLIGTADGVFGMQTDYLSGAWQAVKINDVQIHGVMSDGMLVYDKFDTVNNEHKFDFYFASNSSVFDGKPKPYSAFNGLFRISSRLNSIIPINPFNKPIPNRIFGEVCDVNNVFIPVLSNKQKIYLGTTAGIFISTDAGTTWQRRNTGIQHTIMHNLVSIPQISSNDILVAGMFGAGIYRSTNGGSTWFSSNSGITSPYVTAVAANGNRNVLYAGSTYALYKSTNNGATWTTIDTPRVTNVSRFTSRENQMTIRISPKNPNLILYYSSACGLNLSTNGGSSWEPRPIPSGFDLNHVPENIEFDPVNETTIYMTGSGIFRSTNLGTTWDFNIASNLPLLNIEILSPTINPENNQEIFLATVYSQREGDAYRLFKTTDGGLTWDSLSQRIPAYDVDYDRYDTKRLLASGPGGIFGTTDGGSTWNVLMNAMPNTPFYLLGAHAKDVNVLYAGSENGAWKIQINERPKLAFDSSLYFGSLLLGNDTTLSVTISNRTGLRNVILQFAGLSDSNNFKYSGASVFNIRAGDSISFQIQFSPKSGGMHSAALRFTASDATIGSIQLLLRGHSFERYSIDKFRYDFGSVTVGKDSVVNIEVDNTFGLRNITLNFVGNSDTLMFKYEGDKTVVVDTGTIALLPVRFVPRSAGVKQAYLTFTTTDPHFPEVMLRFEGTGVMKNFASRRVLLDTTFGFKSSESSTLSEYYTLWALSLERADIQVDVQKKSSLSGYNAVVYVLPERSLTPQVIDSLQTFILNGGTVVVLGDSGYQSQKALNEFLSDSTWRKHNVQTGIQFNSNVIVDQSLKDSVLAQYVAAYPLTHNALTYKIDSVVLYTPGSLQLDTAVLNVVPLLAASSPTLISMNEHDSTAKKISSALIAAYSLIGKGKIIAISDYDLWWNGERSDTTKPFGIFAGNNLQFALNIFGLVDNLAARLPQPTPQEVYQLISIPYNFADSSVVTLFKDLGPPNELVWRLFGKWDEKKKAYGEFPKDFTYVRRGEAYWLITKLTTSISFGTTEVKGSEEDFPITLRPGYNMIGNPFPYEVRWANSFREDDSVETVLWYFNGEYDSTTTTMKPFMGYFIKNRGTTNKLIRISSEKITSTAGFDKDEPSASLGLQEWKIQISAVSKKAADERTYIGMLENASNGFDINDFSKPPASPSDYLHLAIRNNGEKLAADYRALSRDGQYWDVTVTSALSNIPVTLSLLKIGSLPSDFKIYILDTKKERVNDVTQSLSYSLTLDKKEYNRNLRVIVGTEQFVEAHTNGIPLVPLEFSLYQNYPNPFNPATSIRYSISHSAHVKLEIFNMLGQKVKTLVQEFQQIGMYLVEWDGTDESMKTVATGVYYYRLEAYPSDGSQKFVNVKKMTLVR